jgi:hypothetical protein
MTSRRGMRTGWALSIGAAAVLVVIGPHPVAAKFKCDLPAKCTVPSVVDEVRAAVDTTCDCAGATSVKTYKKCWKPIFKQFASSLGKTGFPKACRKVVKATLGNSLCGRTGFVLCRKIKQRSGAESCRPKKETKCKDPYPPSSACGAFLTCAEACDPSSCVTTTTTTIMTTTTTLALRFTTGPPSGVCGEAREGGPTGTILQDLSCGGLNLGGGAGTVPEGPTPENAPTEFNLDCTGNVCTVTGRTSAESGSNNNCSVAGCDFGTFLSIPNGGLSTCVHNTFSASASGMIDLNTGEFDGIIPLQSATNVTGNNANPCPSCIANQCDSSASNAGAPCTAINAAGDTYDCLPGGAPLIPFGVNLAPIGTAAQSMNGPGGDFCGQRMTAPGSFGCFGHPTCDYIEERGTAAGTLTTGPAAATLASVFCIPATTNQVIDGAADLPGPGATTLPGVLEILTP